MPTAPDPNSPFLPARLEATLGINAPGTPGVAGNPTPQAAGPMAFPAPPAPATNFPGRPATPKAPTPLVGVPTASKTTATPAQAKPATPTQGATAEAQTATAVPGPKLTPGADGSLAVTPEGDMAYRQAVLAGRDRLGPIPKLFRHPTLPEVPFQLGTHNYNPFTGAWVGPEGGGQ
jgi:hypothetical protein